MPDVERERDIAILERDEMRKANITPEDAARPLGQSVEYWQDRCLDHATAFDNARIERDRYRKALEVICDPEKTDWTAPAMWKVAREALDG